MATIKKISGLDATTTLTGDDFILVEDATNGTLNRTTINALGDAYTHSSSVDATYATKIGTSSSHPAIGSATTPIYVNSDGTPTAISYTIGTSVPSDAVFTDTTYSTMAGASASANGTSGLVPAPAKGKQTSFLRGDGTWGDIEAITNSEIDTICV